MKLKDAEALKEIFKQRERWHFTGIIAAIDDANTVDAVPVVRCKDCKHWGKQVTGNTACCYAWSRYGTVITQMAQWCCYGERKGGE